MPEKLCPSQQWYEDFMAHRGEKDRAHRATTSTPRKDLCKQCQQRSVAKGESSTSKWAAGKGLCSYCYGHPGQALPEKVKQKIVGAHGTCSKCKDRNVAGGKKAAAQRARELGLCKRCYEARKVEANA